MDPSFQLLTHYYRPFSRPLLSLSRLSEADAARILRELARHEDLPYRLTEPAYLPERRRIEECMRTRFREKGGDPELRHPHYFVLGEFSLWERDGSRKVQIPLASVEARWLSFTLTDSFFNYRAVNLRGVSIPRRAYHGELFTLGELSSQLGLHGLSTDRWSSDPALRFDVYVEAQLWSDEPVEHLLGAA
jgi:hypothetical protein